jgi:2-polyprenyl-6-methoxyphenol hydroxylase-like FAD-dependent oxidoreductase
LLGLVQRSFPFFAGVVLAKDSVGKLEVTMRWAMDGGIARRWKLGLQIGQSGAGTVDIGVIAYKRITFDFKANVIAEKPRLQIVTSWDRLRQVLLKAIDRQRYHFGYVFDRVEQDGSGVRVHFASSRSEEADLVVGCDGFRSSVRAHLAPEAQPIYSGY